MKIKKNRVQQIEGYGLVTFDVALTKTTSRVKDSPSLMVSQ